MSHPHLELVKSVLAGDAAARDEVLELCEVSIQVAVSRAGPYLKPEEREDVLQDVRYAVLSSLKNYRGEAGLPGWATAVARNCCRRFIANPERARVVPIDPSDPGVPQLVDPESPPDQRMIDSELKELVRRKLPSRLSPREKVCFRLHFIEGHAPAEVVVLMSTTRGNVDKMLTCIRNHARALVSDLEPSPGDGDGPEAPL